MGPIPVPESTVFHGKGDLEAGKVVFNFSDPRSESSSPRASAKRQPCQSPGLLDLGSTQAASSGSQVSVSGGHEGPLPGPSFQKQFFLKGFGDRYTVSLMEQKEPLLGREG